MLIVSSSLIWFKLKWPKNTQIEVNLRIRFSGLEGLNMAYYLHWWRDVYRRKGHDLNSMSILIDLKRKTHKIYSSWQSQLTSFPSWGGMPETRLLRRAKHSCVTPSPDAGMHVLNSSSSNVVLCTTMRDLLRRRKGIIPSWTANACSWLDKDWKELLIILKPDTKRKCIICNIKISQCMLWNEMGISAFICSYDQYDREKLLSRGHETYNSWCSSLLSVAKSQWYLYQVIYRQDACLFHVHDPAEMLFTLSLGHKYLKNEILHGLITLCSKKEEKKKRLIHHLVFAMYTMARDIVSMYIQQHYLIIDPWKGQKSLWPISE